MDYFRRMNVYSKVPGSEVKSTGGKLLGTRWIDVNMSYEKPPDYRSRLVSKEFKRGFGNTLYAATPHLEGAADHCESGCNVPRRRRQP